MKFLPLQRGWAETVLAMLKGKHTHFPPFKRWGGGGMRKVSHPRFSHFVDLLKYWFTDYSNLEPQLSGYDIPNTDITGSHFSLKHYS